MSSQDRHRVANRHGFKNFGGRKTGTASKIDANHLSAIRWIHLHLNVDKEPYLTTTQFDESLAPMGNIIRYDLRHLDLIHEHDQGENIPKRITLTKKAELYIKYTKESPTTN